MTDRQNTNGKWSYDFSWTQPYVSMNEFFGSKEVQDIMKERAVEQELDSLDRADEAVQNMLTFPDVEAILKKIKET